MEALVWCTCEEAGVTLDGRVVGEGANGFVRIVSLRGRDVALKTPKLPEGESVPRAELLDSIMLVAERARRSAGPGVPGVHCVLRDQAKACFGYVMDLFDTSAYNHFVQPHAERPALLLDQLLVIRGGASGVASIHAAGYCHRDLKADNFLVRFSDKGIAGSVSPPPSTIHTHTHTRTRCRSATWITFVLSPLTSPLTALARSCGARLNSSTPLTRPREPPAPPRQKSQTSSPWASPFGRCSRR